MCSDTKEKIAEAVEQMMLTKPVSKITVQSVMEQAQMKRQTFYYHYQDIYSVLEWIVVREICTPLRYDESVSAEDWCMQALTLLRARQPLLRRISPALGREKLYQLTAGILRPQLARFLPRTRHAGRRDVPARAGYALLRRVLHARQSCRQPDAAQCRDLRAEHARAVRDDAAGVMNFTEALLFSGFAHTMLCAYPL